MGNINSSGTDETGRGNGTRREEEAQKRTVYFLDPKVLSCLVPSPSIDYLISEDKDYILLILVTVDEKGSHSKPEKLKVA